MDFVGVVNGVMKSIKWKEKPAMIEMIMVDGVGKDVGRMLERYQIEVVDVSFSPYRPHPKRPNQVHDGIANSRLRIVRFLVKSSQAELAEMYGMYYGMITYGFPKFNDSEFSSRRSKMPKPPKQELGRGGGTGYGRGNPKPQEVKDKEKRDKAIAADKKRKAEARKKNIRKVKKFLTT